MSDVNRIDLFVGDTDDDRCMFNEFIHVFAVTSVRRKELDKL